MEKREAADRQSRPNLREMPDAKARLAFDREFTRAEYDRIALGLLPRDMDDKWLIFLEDNWLYFHRSWVGTCVYQLRLEPEDDRSIVAEAWVNRDPARYKAADDAQDVRLLSFLIDNFLLGKAVPFPAQEEDAKWGTGATQHNFSGTGYRETVVGGEPDDKEDETS